MPKKIPVSKFLVLFDPPEKLQYIRTPPNVRQVCQKLLVPNLYELILRHIIDILGKKDYGKISRWEIATALRISPDTVSRGIKYLKRKKLLNVILKKHSGDTPEYSVPLAMKMKEIIALERLKNKDKFQQNGEKDDSNDGQGVD